MYIRILPAAAMPHINGVLHHGKSIFLQIFPELCIVFPVLLGFRWQVKKDEDPQNLVLI